MRPSEVCPELARDVIAEQLEATDEAKRLREAQKQLDQCKEDRAAVEDSLTELRADLTREGAAADLSALRSQQRILTDIEADLIVSAAQAWDAAQRRLRNIETNAKQTIFVEALQQKSEAVLEIASLADSILDRIAIADARQSRANSGDPGFGRYGSGENERTYRRSSYDDLIGQRPDDQKAKITVGEPVAVA